MTNPFRTDLIAIFIRRGHKGKEIVEMVREIEAFLDGQRCEWTLSENDPIYGKTLQLGCGKDKHHPYFFLRLDKYPFCPCCGKRIEVKDGQG